MLLNEIYIGLERDEEPKNVIDRVMDSKEFKDLTKIARFVSSDKELKNGTMVFDTGIAPQFGINYRGPVQGGTYFMKIYADGQIREQVVGQSGSNFKDIGSHYRIGKKITAPTLEEMYKAALVDVLARTKRKIEKRFKMGVKK